MQLLHDERSAIRRIPELSVPSKKAGNFWLNRILILFLLQIISTYGFGQLVVTGSVKTLNGDAFAGVSVTLKGTKTGTVTDSRGSYSLNVPAGTGMLIFSFVGYKQQEVNISGRKTIDITLLEEQTSLDGVVVIGYGKLSRTLITTSISKLDMKVLQNVPYSNTASALQGTLPGIRVQNTSGQPGATPIVVVRGGTSINNPNGASPLYIIDGVTRSDMNHVNAQDIESIQVLKDAASTAIYGARGSNGVVLITTRSGKSGNVQISYNGSLTISKVGRLYDMISARDYVKFYRMSVVAKAQKKPNYFSVLGDPLGGGTGNDLTKNTPYTTQYLTPENEHKLNEGWESMPDPIDATKTLIFGSVDWQDVIFRTGVSQNHYLSASGGSGKATFNMGAGYLRNIGTAINTDYTRASLNLSGELKARDNLNFFSRLMYSNASSHGGAWPWDRAQGAPPTMKYRFEDGTLAPGDDFKNPEYVNSTKLANKNIDNSLTMIVGSHWEIMPGLSFDPQISYYQLTNHGREFQTAFWDLVSRFNDTRPARGFFSNYSQKQADAVFSYTKSVNNTHNITATAGFSSFARTIEMLDASGQGAATDLIPTLNASPVPVDVNGSETEQVIVGYFARANYDYKQKYILSVSSRYDGASNLGNNHKWGFFPGVSVGWNVSKENFWQIFREGLFQLKLRASYGINGNISGLGDYQSQGEYSVSSLYDANSAIRNTILANQDLEWEKSKTFNFGTDIGLFNSRVRLIFDYYRRITDKLLTELTLPQETGFASIFTNLGSMENKGMEIGLNVQVLRPSSTFQWDVSFNGARNQNKILKLPYNGTENNRVGGFYVWDNSKNDYAWLGGLQEGGRIGDLYAWRQVSIFSTDEEAAAGPLDLMVTGSNKSKYGGDVNWLDNDKNDTIDTRDRVYLGNIYPLWTGGVTNSFSYKNFNLIIRCDYTTGHTIYDWGTALMLGSYGTNGSATTAVLRSWQKQGDVTDIARYILEDQNSQNNFTRSGKADLHGGNSLFYQSGNYLAVREVTLSYNLPVGLLQRSGISSLRFYVTGNNLHYFTNYGGLNPEVSGQTKGSYSLPRSVILGANISF